ncbi:MAG: hypothetical protein ACREX7_03180, partial [Casimicrobiaceae bacterium]
MTGNVVRISGNYVHCFVVGFPEPPPMILDTSLEPLAAGDYTVVFTASPDPPNGWPIGNNESYW